MVEHMPRLQAQQAILDSAVAMYPHISQEARDQQMSIWQKVAKFLGMARGAIEEVLWDGTVPEDLPANVTVAEDWGTVMKFFNKASKGGPPILNPGG